ncbi:hypothetical protein EP7_005119 [Isosphaeraceae bacterium EP7]
MTCHDFEQRWARRLDALRGDGEAVAAPSPDLEAHAEACAECRPRHERMRTLERAITLWASRPDVPVGLTDRVVEGWNRPRLRIWERPLVRLALAASIVAASAVAWTLTRPGRVEEVPPVVAATNSSLDDALAEATGATLGLARMTSAPAGRLGRAMFGLAAPLAAETPDLMPQVQIDPTPAPGRLRAMADRVGAGLVPISGTARKAFGFLLMQPPDAAEPLAGRGGRSG